MKCGGKPESCWGAVWAGMAGVAWALQCQCQWGRRRRQWVPLPVAVTWKLPAWKGKRERSGACRNGKKVALNHVP